MTFLWSMCATSPSNYDSSLAISTTLTYFCIEFTLQPNESSRWATIGIQSACDAKNVANDWILDVMLNTKVCRIVMCRATVHCLVRNYSVMAHALSRTKVSVRKERQHAARTMDNHRIHVTIWSPN